jgi:hypothetical protein
LSESELLKQKLGEMIQVSESLTIEELDEVRERSRLNEKLDLNRSDIRNNVIEAEFLKLGCLKIVLPEELLRNRYIENIACRHIVIEKITEIKKSFFKNKNEVVDYLCLFNKRLNYFDGVIPTRVLRRLEEIKDHFGNEGIPFNMDRLYVLFVERLSNVFLPILDPVLFYEIEGTNRGYVLSMWGDDLDEINHVLNLQRTKLIEE